MQWSRGAAKGMQQDTVWPRHKVMDSIGVCFANARTAASVGRVGEKGERKSGSEVRVENRKAGSREEEEETSVSARFNMSSSSAFSDILPRFPSAATSGSV
eukprot:560645-Rhodomonas_salina.3